MIVATTSEISSKTTEQAAKEVAEEVKSKRYYRKDDDGKPIEDWNGLSKRVVNHVCSKEDESFKKKILDLIENTKFLPNSPCLVNSGTSVGGLLACFVTKSPEDSWVGMMENMANFGHIARRGGGCGVDFSLIRPEGDPVFGSTHAKACGPIEHMRVVSEAMSSITQAGFRGMANMGTLRIDHPDIMKFIVCKQHDRALRTLLKEDIFNQYNEISGNAHTHLKIVLDKFISNFNISAVVTDDFMQKVEADEDFDLVFNGKRYATMKAREIFDAIITNAWNNGDPGMLFYDRMNDAPYKWSKQEITATNPCGEQQLPQYGSCNLGSIDVSKFYDEGKKDVSWGKLRNAIHTAVQFLDDVIDINKFPTDDFAKWAKENRPVGLGIMGWADLLLKKRLAYGSPKSLVFADELASFFAKEAHKKSVELGKDRGTPKSCRHAELEYRRNVTTISIAPTGSIAILAACSCSAEPIYSHTIFMYNNTGSYELHHPDSKKSFFRCALDTGGLGREVLWQQHVDMQATFQKHCDSGISKTINMSSDATIKDVSDAYKRAWEKGCKGITIYRDGSKSTQVLNTKEKGSVRLGTAECVKRPREVLVDIFKTTADGFEWHLMFGKVDRYLHEVFAVNGKQELPSQGIVIKRKKRHYSLVDMDKNILIENLAEEEMNIDPKIGLETRRFSLELRHGIHPKFICEQIDKSNETVTSFSKAVTRMIKKHYLTEEDCCSIAASIACPSCADKGNTHGMISEAGCLKCQICGYSKCG